MPALPAAVMVPILLGGLVAAMVSVSSVGMAIIAMRRRRKTADHPPER